MKFKACQPTECAGYEVIVTFRFMVAFALAAILLSAEPRFETDVLPLLTKAGCNSGACHGAAAGRGGLKLSLFAGSPAADYDALVRELEGRRINRKRPAESLFIAKPAGMIDHEGGVRFDFDGPEARLLADWVAAGAPRAKSGLLRSLSLQPSEVLAHSVPQESSLKVIAQLDDGTKRDVTGMSVFTPGDDAAVQVHGAGKLTILRPGRHTVIVRYLSQVIPLSITARDKKETTAPSTPPASSIDAEVEEVLRDLGLDALSRADDAALFRRASLALTGELPAENEVRGFFADASADKYERLVDRLLASNAFVDFWTWRFARQLRVRTGPNDERGVRAFHHWIGEQVRKCAPYDQMVRTMLTASGDSHENGAANFHRSAAGAREEAEYVAESLLGIRLRCANCHNHPLDRWTQDDYHGLAAIFARLDRGRVVRLLGSGHVDHPVTGEAALARIPGVRFLTADDGRSADYRPELANWLTERDSPFLARAQVNRLWKGLFGRGLVEPADDLRDTNPATHPRLLEQLSREFAESGFDLRRIVRRMALSAAFQRTSVPEGGGRGDSKLLAIQETYYAGFPRHPLEAEVLLDAIASATDVPVKFKDVPIGTLAVQLIDPARPEPSLAVLGACSRQESCDSAPVGVDPLGKLTTQLHFLNGGLLNERLQRPGGMLNNAIVTGKSNWQIVEQLYLRAFSRLPSEREQEFWTQELQSGDDETRQQKLQDLLWAILYSREFTTNH